MKNNLILFLLGIMFISCSNRNEIIELETTAFLLSIDNTGSIVKIIDRDSGNNYLSTDTTAAILSIKVIFLTSLITDSFSAFLLSIS